VSNKVLKAFSNYFPPAVVTEGKRVHSLFTLLLKEHLTAVEEFLKSGSHKVMELHRKLGSIHVDFKRLEPLDYTRKSLLNINRREELYEAVCRRAYKGC